MLQGIAFKLFGGLASRFSFSSMKETLKKSGSAVTAQEYISLVIFYAVLAFVLSLVVSIVFVSLLIHTPQAYAVAFMLPFILFMMTIVMGYIYPSLKVRNLKNRIDRSLPFAVFYMATTASSGAHPVNIFRMLSMRGGPIGEEANRIYTNVKTMGMDIVTAMEKAAARTPSPRFAELLWGMVSIITTGGNLESYLKGRTRTAMSQYRRALNDYAKTIGLYTEIYITLIIVGSLFFIILLAIISPLVGGNTLFLQTFLVFFFVPLISVGFIMLLKGVSPTE